MYVFLMFPVWNHNSGNIQQKTGECIKCHSDLLENLVIHPDIESSCDICHSPTGETHPDGNKKGFTLAEKLPELCFNCHSDFQENVGSYKIVHGALKDSRSCINCHNPHSSSQQHLLIPGGNNLCFSCHNKEIMYDSIKIKNIKKDLASAKSIHAPIESGGCITCHNPHFSEKNHLLVAGFPAGQYINSSKENYELCFMCHDSKLLEAQTSKTATNFRNGTINLHFVHVNKEKGRSCIMCHDVHGAPNERLITDRINFGSWEMKIEFKTSENGGTCLTACHGEKTYNRDFSE